MNKRYIVRCDEKSKSFESLQDALAEKDYLIDMGYENVEMYDTVTDKFI